MDDQQLLRYSRHILLDEIGPDALPPRLDFGSDEDFTLKQAINHLKGAPVIESVKSLSAQAKTQ
jgi:hypothetical protein